MIQCTSDSIFYEKIGDAKTISFMINFDNEKVSLNLQIIIKYELLLFSQVFKLKV